MVTVIADVRSNSIVVSGTKDDLRLLHDLIDKVDIVLPQVRIEVVIAEVTLSDNDENGFSALGATVNNGRLVSVGGTVIGGTVAGPGGVGQATVTAADLRQSNGIIHVTDAVSLGVVDQLEAIQVK